MPELNREEIIKALECCNTGTAADCAKCPRADVDRTLSSRDCMEILMCDALALIKQLTEENERLKKAKTKVAREILNAFASFRALSPNFCKVYNEFEKKYIGEKGE